MWTPLHFKQQSVGQTREGTAEGLNLQVEFYYGLVTNALLGDVLRELRRRRAYPAHLRLYSQRRKYELQGVEHCLLGLKCIGNHASVRTKRHGRVHALGPRADDGHGLPPGRRLVYICYQSFLA